MKPLLYAMREAPGPGDDHVRGAHVRGARHLPFDNAGNAGRFRPRGKLFSAARLGAHIRAEDALVGERTVAILDDDLAWLVGRGEGAGELHRALARVAGIARLRLALLRDAP